MNVTHKDFTHEVMSCIDGRPFRINLTTNKTRYPLLVEICRCSIPDRWKGKVETNDEYVYANPMFYKEDHWEGLNEANPTVRKEWFTEERVRYVPGPYPWSETSRIVTTEKCFRYVMDFKWILKFNEENVCKILDEMLKRIAEQEIF